MASVAESDLRLSKLIRLGDTRRSSRLSMPTSRSRRFTTVLFEKFGDTALPVARQGGGDQADGGALIVRQFGPFVI